MKNRKPRRESDPSQKKMPKAHSISTENKKLVWKMSRIDENSEWGWDKINCPYFLKQIWKTLRHFESMTWAEILGSKHHSVDVSLIDKQAQKRLQELKYDDNEILVSFRIGGKQRIWGIRSGVDSYLLWWDPKHRIYPSPKKHT